MKTTEMARVQLSNNRFIEDFAEPYIVAEINTSHFGRYELAVKMIDEARAYAANLAGGIHRLEIKYHAWPWWTLCSHRKLPAQKQVEYAAFFYSPRCCRDECWSEPYHSQLKAPSDMGRPDQVHMCNLGRLNSTPLIPDIAS